MSETKEPLTQKCPYYQEGGKCAFWRQGECTLGDVPVCVFVCGVVCDIEKEWEEKP